MEARRAWLPRLVRDWRLPTTLLAMVAVLAAWLVLAGQDDGAPSARGTATATATVPGGYTVKVRDVVTDCRQHSRGEVQGVFATTPCRSAQRFLAIGTVDARPVLYVVSRITMASAADAAALKVVIDGTGTGNINDLLRDGATFAGAPKRMPRSGYASLQDVAVLLVAEAGFTDDGATSNTDPRLRAAAAAVANHVAQAAG